MSQSAFSWIDAHSVPVDDESAFHFAQTHTSSDRSRLNLAVLRTIVLTEISHTSWVYGYAFHQVCGRFLFLATAKDTDEIIGLANCFQIEQRQLYFGLVTAVAVLPEYRKRGIGRTMLQEIGHVLQNTRRVRAPLSAASKAVSTIVPARNQAALQFFERSGYTAMNKGDLYHFNHPLPQ